MTTIRSTKSNLNLEKKDLQKRVISLFSAISNNKRLRDSFIKNPTKQITEKVTLKKLPPQQISEANRLLFSLISNEKMLHWLDSYGKDKKMNTTNKRKFIIDFSKQIAKLGDENISISILSNAASGYGIPGLGDFAYQCVCNELPDKNSCACTPVAKDTIPVDYTNIQPDMLRTITEHLISHGIELRNTGKLSDLSVQIR